MTKVAILPSLSEKGWVTDSTTILTKLISFYILTDAGQTLLFQGNLTSLPETYFKHINNPTGLANAIQGELTILLERYFDSVEVKVDVEEGEDALSTLLLYAVVIDHLGVRTNLGRVVDMDNEGVKKVIQINNYGEGKALLKG